MPVNQLPVKCKDIKFLAIDMLSKDKVRYLIVGGFNTIIGYCLGIGLYYAMSPRFHIIVIGTVGNILAITFSFTTYKLFVFRTRGHWLGEYLRSYLVYGGMGLVGIVLLWILVDGLHLPIWLAQGIGIPIMVILSYFGQSRFSFRSSHTSESRHIT